MIILFWPLDEFYNDKITENSIYRTDFCGRSLFLDDTFIEEVIFEPDKNINFDDLKANDGYDLEYQLYIANHCDVRVHISACLLYTSPSPRDTR